MICGCYFVGLLICVEMLIFVNCLVDPSWIISGQETLLQNTSDSL